MEQDLVWDVRTFVYEQFASLAQAPTVEATARRFGISHEKASELYQELNRRHALFLNPGSTTIRMANPFSAVATAYRVHAGGVEYWANCAWDSLGIPSALHSDATIQAECAEDGQPILLPVKNGHVIDQGECIHFMLPFSRWYEDLIQT